MKIYNIVLDVVFSVLSICLCTSNSVKGKFLPNSGFFLILNQNMCCV